MMRLAFVALFAAACGQVSVTAPDAAPDAATPTLTAISPSSGIVTAMVTVTGTNFGAAQGHVSFAGIDGMVMSWSDSSIVVAVPNIPPQMAAVVVTTAAGATVTGQQFQIVLPPRAYVHTQASAPTTGLDYVVTMTFDPTAKTLTEMGSATTTGMPPPGFGGCSHSLVVNVATRRLFVGGANGIGVYDIDPVTGALSQVPGSPFTPMGGVPAGNIYGVEVNQAGTKLWAASGSILVFDIAADGSLTQEMGSPFPDVGMTSSDVLVLSQSEKFLYVNSETSQFTAFSTSDMAALTGAPYSQGFYTFYITRRPTTEQIFLPGQNGLSVWQPDPTTGVPTQITGSPFAIGTSLANGIAFAPDGSHGYVADFDTNHIAEFSLDATGKPTLLTGSPANLVASPGTFQAGCLAVSADGKFIAAAALNSEVAVATINADSTITPIAGNPFSYTEPAGPSGFAITF